MTPKETKDCDRCLGTGMGQIRVENSKCIECGGRGFFNVKTKDEENDDES